MFVSAHNITHNFRGHDFKFLVTSQPFSGDMTFGKMTFRQLDQLAEERDFFFTCCGKEEHFVNLCFQYGDHF